MWKSFWAMLQLKILITAGLVILYFASPIDLIPDFIIPPVGYADDCYIVFLGVRYLVNSIKNSWVKGEIKRTWKG